VLGVIALMRRPAVSLPRLLLRSFLSIWMSPVHAGLATLIIYTVLTIISRPPATVWHYRLDQTPNAYFVFLADAFLHGQLGLLAQPAYPLDVSFYNGHYYLYWPPFPGLLFLPLVALFGPGVSDVPLHLALAALNVALVGLILKALPAVGLAPLTGQRRAWLTMGCALGTVHLFLACFSSVWYTSQVVAFTLSCAAYLAALQAPRPRAPLLVGALLACGVLTRTPLILTGVWIAWYLWRTRDRSDRGAPVRLTIVGLTPIVLALGLFATYNYFRFGSPTDYGYAYHAMNSGFVADYQQFGPFNIHYMPINLFYNFVALPYLAWLGPDPGTSFWMGGSLFLMSPMFLLAFPGLRRCWRTHGWALALTIVMGLAPMLLLMGTGSLTLGPRYTLDITVPLLIATGIGAVTAPLRLIAIMVLIGLVMYIPGTIWFGTLA
jgi:hypothetical protein